MKRLMVALFFLWPSSVLALTPSQKKAMWSASLAAYSRQDFKKSRDLLYRLVKLEPSNALYWFNLGNSFFMLRSFNRAEICFAKVERLGSPLAPAARLYRSKAMTGRGDRDGARVVLESLIRQPLPPALRDEASRDLIALKGSEGDGSTGAAEALKLYKGGQYKRALRVLREGDPADKNLRVLKAMILIKLDREEEAHGILKNLQGSESGEIRDLVTGILDRIRDSYSRKSWIFVEGAAGSAWLADFGAGVRWWTQDLWYANVGYSGRVSEFPDERELGTISHEARVNVGREVGADLLLFTPYAVHESWAGKPARLSSGLALKVRGGEDTFEYGLDADWTAETSLSDDLKYLEGSTQRYRVYFGSIYFPVYARVYLTMDRRDIGDQTYANGDVEPAAYRGLGPGGRVLWRFRRDWIGEASVNFTTRSYPTKTQPENAFREDKEFNISARITRLLKPTLSLYLSAAHTRTQTAHSYTESQILFGGVWDAL